MLAFAALSRVSKNADSVCNVTDTTTLEFQASCRLTKYLMRKKYNAVFRDKLNYGKKGILVYRQFNTIMFK